MKIKTNIVKDGLQCSLAHAKCPIWFIMTQHFSYISYFFLNSVLRPFQDYFSSYETGQSVGGTKTGEPREKPPDTPASRTWLVSHVARAGLEPTPDTAVR